MRIVLLPLALLTACATMPPADGPTTLGHAQRVGRFRVTPLAVEKDSRCPMNARCIWAGRVVVRAAIRDGRSQTVRKLTLGEVTAPGVVLDGVTPERVAGGAPQHSPVYRFHFSVAAAR